MQIDYATILVMCVLLVIAKFIKYVYTSIKETKRERNAANENCHCNENAEDKEDIK
jgi:hypothetical protein